MTQREAQPSTKRLLVPPLTLSFTISQERRDHCEIHAQVYSGSHQFVHRKVDAYFDSFSEIPVMIGSSMLSWTLWLVQFEAERRATHQGSPRVPQARFPDWPSPERSPGPHDGIEF
jgi:hypothetical protein